MTAPAEWAPVRRAAARIGALCLVTLALALGSRLAGLPDLRTAAALALSLGLGGAVVANLHTRPRLAWLWAEITVWVGLAFAIASIWNALWAGVTAATGVDLGLTVALLAVGFALPRAARTAAEARG